MYLERKGENNFKIEDLQTIKIMERMYSCTILLRLLFNNYKLRTVFLNKITFAFFTTVLTELNFSNLSSQNLK